MNLPELTNQTLALLRRILGQAHGIPNICVSHKMCYSQGAHYMYASDFDSEIESLHDIIVGIDANLAEGREYFEAGVNDEWTELGQMEPTIGLGFATFQNLRGRDVDRPQQHQTEPWQASC
jgi:hypothetical protein